MRSSGLARFLVLVGTRRKRMYRIGDVVQVKIYKVDLLKREIDFIHCEGQKDRARHGQTIPV